MTMVSHRSTKGASKARRDHINHEIRNMRALLPITQEDQERLSYLHSMAAICTYIRKSVLLQGIPSGVGAHCPLPYEAFLQALPGFIVVTTVQGKLVYVSENVSEYLGFSMLDVLQGDTLYDMAERSDVDVVKSNLDIESNSSSERSFICCMQTSKAFKLQRLNGSCCSMMVRGSFLSVPQSSLSSSSVCPSSQSLFVALCTPTVNRLWSSDSHLCQSFNSVHRLDMTFTLLSDSVLYFLGYSAEEMSALSWYSLVHPEDLSLSADSHRSLVKADEGFQVEMVLRLQCQDLSWTWVYIRANRELQSVSCTNFIISETEARFLQQNVSRDAFRPSSLENSCRFAAQPVSPTNSYHNTNCCKRQRTSNSRSDEPSAKVRRESDIYCVTCSSPVPSGDGPALFTPPYSPASSSSPLQQEELSHDLLMDMHGYTDQLLSSPECSPSYYSYPEAGLTCHQSPSASLPVAEHAFVQAAFSALGAHSPPSSPPLYDFPACTADARLVPDCPSVSDLCESPVDCALHQDDFSLLEQPQGGDIVQVHQVPHHVLSSHSSLLTPNQSPSSTESHHYNEREQAEISILAQQISSLASSFAMYHTANPLQNTMPSACEWHHAPLPSALPLKHELVLDDGVFDSILKDLEVATRKSNASGPGVEPYSSQHGLSCCRTGPYQLEPEPLGFSSTITGEQMPAEQFAVTDPFSVQLGRHHDQNTGLHQLNHNMQSALLQDGLAEENLY